MPARRRCLERPRTWQRRAEPKLSKQNLLLLPGLLCDAVVWERQVSLLSDIADSRIPDYGTIDTLQGMAASVLRDAPAKFALCGHSMGGRVALEVLRQAPERVTRLALMDTGVHGFAAGEAGEKEKRERYELLAIAREKGMRVMGEKWASGMVHPDRLTDAPLMNAILDMIERKTPDIFAAQINALLNRSDAEPLLSKIDLPSLSLILVGREDGWSPVARHEQIAARLPHSFLHIVENCGHMSTMEQPEEIADVMRGWLTA